MRSTTTLQLVLATTMGLLLVSGCSTVKNLMPGSGNSSVGDQMLSQAKETSALGKNWNEGQKLVEKGKRLASRSEKLARESREVQAEAESLMARGKSLIQSSEQTYQAAFGETRPESMR